MSDLIAFLNARLDEDEAMALATMPGATMPGTYWQATGEDILVRGPDAHWDGAAVANASGPEADHIARHDPDRVLREVAVKREILDACLEVGATDQKPPKVPDYIHGVIVGQGDALRGIVQILAAVYSDHPDYRQQWAS